MATTEGQANNFDEPSAQKHFMSYIICVENQKQNLWVSSEFVLAENIFGRKTYLVLNCEDWYNMVFSQVLCLALTCLHIILKKENCVESWLVGSSSMFWQPCYRKQPYQSRQAKSEWGNSNYTVSHKNVFRHFSFTHLYLNI